MTRKNHQQSPGKITPFLVAALLIPITVIVYQTLLPALRQAAGDFFYPYLKVSRTAVKTVSDYTLLLRSKTELAAALEEMSKLNGALALQAAAALELSKENAELRRLSGLPPSENWQYLNAQVLLHDPLMWQEHFTINRGKSDGIGVGDAVIDINSGGVPVLVGVVHSTGKHTSTVHTPFNAALKLSGRIGRDTIGFINAGDRQRTRELVPIEYLPSDAKCVPGESVFTTGFEQKIPGGLKIGELQRIDENPNFHIGSGRSGMVKPAFSPHHLRFLTIVHLPENPPETRQ